MDKKENKRVKKEKSSDNIKKDIKENYKMGIEYYQDVEEHDENPN